MKRTICSLTLLAALTFGAATAQAAQTVRLEECGPMAERFAFVVDVSGSMMERIGKLKEKAAAMRERPLRKEDETAGNFPAPEANPESDPLRRIELAKAFVEKSSRYALEHTDMRSALYSVAPFAELVPEERRTKDDFLAAAEERLRTDLEIFGRPTWLGDRGLKKLSEAVERPRALILVTDGHFDLKTEGKASPIEAMKAYAAINPNGSLTIVSAAYLPEEREAVRALARAHGNARLLELEDLMRDEAKFEDFVSSTFYRDCSRVATLEIQDVYFDFDRSTLKAESIGTLRKVLDVIAKRDPSERITVIGWTDWTGSNAYNAGLSVRRSEAVRRFLIREGVSAERLDSVGRGKSFKYDNRLKEGRRLNRRVELLFDCQDPCGITRTEPPAPKR